jgi:hypothetical protein
MNEAELTALMDRLVGRCRDVFGEKGASVVFRNLRELARL